jgi:hypothetical protein
MYDLLSSEANFITVYALRQVGVKKAKENGVLFEKFMLKSEMRVMAGGRVQKWTNTVLYTISWILKY